MILKNAKTFRVLWRFEEYVKWFDSKNKKKKKEIKKERITEEACRKNLKEKKKKAVEKVGSKFK